MEHMYGHVHASYKTVYTTYWLREAITKKKLLFFWILSKLFSNLSTLEAILYQMAAVGGPKCPRKYLGQPV